MWGPREKTRGLLPQAWIPGLGDRVKVDSALSNQWGLWESRGEESRMVPKILD